MARPSKFDPKLSDELVAHMRAGFSFESFAAKAGVHRDTLYEWTRRHKAFSDAKKVGEAASLYFWERMGIALATGADITDRNDNVLVHAKRINVTAWIFTMKCRFREAGWRDDMPAAPADDPNKAKRAFTLNYQRKDKTK